MYTNKCININDPKNHSTKKSNYNFSHLKINIITHIIKNYNKTITITKPRDRNLKMNHICFGYFWSVWP